MASDLCVRWGSGADRCIRGFDHTGLCRNSDGETIYTLAQWRTTDGADAVETAEYHERKHRFEDAEEYPGQIDPWADR